MQWQEYAVRQGGVVSRRQLLASGCSPSRISRLRGNRLLVTRWPGVYRAEGAPMTPIAAQWATVLDTGAALSYLSAAEWWDMPVAADGRVHVTVPRRRRTRLAAGIRVHRVGTLPDALDMRWGMPVTAQGETVVDCLGWLALPAARTLLDRALQQGWVDRSDIEQRLDGQPGRWGNRQLRRLLAESQDGARAESERRVLRLLRSANIGGWVANYPVRLGSVRYVVDVAFPERRLAIEIDGWAHHSDVERFRGDRRRQNALVAAGWTVLRFTWADVTESPDRIIATLLSVLAA